MTTPWNPLRSDTVDVIVQQLKAVGIEVRKFLNPDIFAGKETPRSLEGGRIQTAMFVGLHSPFIAGNETMYRSPNGPDIGENYTRAADRGVDALLSRINVETDPEEAVKLGNEVDRLLWRGLYSIPLYQKPDLASYNSDYTGMTGSFSDVGPLWDATRIALKEGGSSRPTRLPFPPVRRGG
jgi:peptide/nickel transport system substrate-binding protein